jgi:hypothetical protein
MKPVTLVALAACASASPIGEARHSPAPPRNRTPVMSSQNPICRAIATVTAAAYDRFEPLLASIDPIYAATSKAYDQTFVTGGPSKVRVPGATTSVELDFVVGIWSATFDDASADAFTDVAAIATHCPALADWTLERDEPNDVEWYLDRQYEMGPLRRIEVRVNRMLASDPLALEPKQDALWLTISVSPAPARPATGPD